MKKSLSLVVALAMVFTLLTPAMAFAATSQENAAGAQLKGYGVLTGNSEGDLLLDRELDREDMIVLLSRLMGKADEAAATENTHGWEDVTDPFYHGYISWAKNEGLTNGVGDGSTFGYDKKLTVQELIQFQLRALGYNDVAWNDVPAKAVELNLVAAGTNMTAVATRGNMAVVTLKTLGTPVNGSDKVLGAELGIEDFIDEATITSFKATGAKKLTVEFAGEVDTSKASISVKRGTNSVSIDKTSWNDQGTVATLELASKLFEGTYEVTVSGVAEEALTASVAVVNEFVKNIEIINDVAPISRTADLDEPQQIEVNFKVTNNYGEDVTGDYVLNGTSSGGNVNAGTNGVATITRTSGEFRIDETVVLTLIHVESTATATKTLKVGNVSAASNVQFVELYNEDADAKLTSDTTNEEAFKIIVKVTDQYGNVINDADILNKELLVYVSGTHVISVNNYNANDNKAEFEEVVINGETKTGLSLANLQARGSAIVTFIARASGKSTNVTIEVAEGLTFDKISLNPIGGIVAAGEDVKVPVTVTDKRDQIVADVDQLNKALANKKITVTVSGLADDEEITFVKENNQTYLKFNATEARLYSVLAVTESGKSDNTMITVRDKAEPKVVAGLKDVNSLIFYEQTLSIEAKHLRVEDQYGRIMSEDGLKAALNGDFDIKATSGSGDAVGITTELMNAGGDKVVLSGSKKGSKTITFSLIKNDAEEGATTVAGSQYSSTFRTVVLDEIKSFEVAGIGTIFADPSYTKDIKVNGITADGKKVELPAAQYNVDSDNGVVVKENLITIDATNANGVKDGDVTFKVYVTINKTGDVLEAEGTATSKAPKVASVSIENSAGVLADKVLEKDSLAVEDLTLKVKDQYGKELVITKQADGESKFPNDNPRNTATSTGEPTIVFSSIESDSATVAKNGTNDATISNLESGDKFNLTVRYGSVSATITVTVK